MEMYAYIDESGDDGIGGKGTKWFVLTTLVANQEEASSLGEIYKHIKQRINYSDTKPLHWTELSHPRKKAVIDELAKGSFSICSVLVDTQHEKIVNTTPKLRGRRLYFYAFRYLIERISWYCDDCGYKVRIYAENKAGIKYKDLDGYLKHIQEQPDCEIRKDCILALNPKAKSQSSIVQLTDCISGAIYNAIEHRDMV